MSGCEGSNLPKADATAETSSQRAIWVDASTRFTNPCTRPHAFGSSVRLLCRTDSTFAGCSYRSGAEKRCLVG